MTQILAKKHWRLNLNMELGGVKRSDILFMTRHLSIALKNGLTLQDGLEMLQEESASNVLRRLLGEILEAIRSGQSFHEALSQHSRYFSPIYINLVKTGELSGTLENNLGHLAEQLKKTEELRQKVRSALMYPMLILVAVLGLGFSVAFFILPKILPLFKSLNVALPLSTRALLFIADLVDHYQWRILLGLAGFFIFLGWLLHQRFMKPVLHRLILKLPVLKGIIRNIQLERFSRTLGILIKSAIPLNQGLLITADATTNQVYRRAIASLVTEVEKGESMAKTMRAYPALFPSLACRMIGMGEKTGSMESTLIYLADMYADEVDNTMKNLSTILEPFLLIVIGLLVGLVAISILGPIYKITGGLRQ